MDVFSRCLNYRNVCHVDVSWSIAAAGTIVSWMFRGVLLPLQHVPKTQSSSKTSTRFQPSDAKRTDEFFLAISSAYCAGLRNDGL